MSGHRIILLGAGGHARMLQLFLTRCGHTVLGCVSPAPPDQTSDLQWLGDDDWLAAQGDTNTKLVNGIGSVGNTHFRRRAFIAAMESGKSFLDYCHPSATVDAQILIGVGIQVLAGAIIQPGCQIGQNVLVNSGAVLEHDVTVADHAHIGPRACVCGGVRIEEGVHIGAGSTVLQGCTIGQGAVVGAGAVVLTNVPPATTVVGVPARPVPKRKTYG